MNTNAQTYESLWKKVDNAVDDDLPQQVISNAEVILKKAKKEKNFAQEMKAWVMIVNVTREMSPDSMKVLTPPDYKSTPANDAVVNALMATGVSSDRSMRNKQDFSEEDSARAYYYNKVLENKEALYQTKVDDYLPLLDKGKDSRLYGDDMLSVMTDFLINHMNGEQSAKRQLCHEVAEFYKGKGNMNAYALLTVKEICHFSFDTPYSVRAKRMQELFEETKGLEAGEDVAQYYYDNYRFSYKDTDTDRLAFVREMKDLFPKSTFFANREKSLINPMCELSFPNSNIIICPDKPFPLKIRSRNLDKAILEVRLHNGSDKSGNILTNGKLIQRKEFSLEKKEVEFTEVTDSLSLPAERYVFILKGADDENVQSFDIMSHQHAISEIGDKKYLVKVLDKTSGKPIKGVAIRANANTTKETRNAISDQNGEAVLDFSNETKSASWTIKTVLSDRDVTEETLYVNTYLNGHNNDNDVRFHIALDRPVYRPGQTMKMAVVVYQTDAHNLNGKNANVVANESVEISVYDPDGKESDSKTLVTNSLGSTSYDFSIPKDAKVGRYTVRVGSKDSKANSSFSVEEYKRPTYFVECLNDDKEESSSGKAYSFNDTLPVIIQAKAFSGVPVQGAKVSYTISTGFGDFWRPTLLINEETLDEGETFTDKEGKVTIPMFLDDTILENMEDESSRFIGNSRLVRFQVSYTVTDLAGESHEGNYSIGIARKAFILKFSPTKYIEFDGLTTNNTSSYYCDLSSKDNSFTIRALNSEGKSVGSSEILNPHYDILNRDSVVVASGEWTPDSVFSIPELNDGSYIFRTSADDKNGNHISEDYILYLFNSKNAAVPGKSSNVAKSTFNDPLLIADNQKFSADKPFTIYFAPKYDNTILYCIITADGGYVEKKQFVLDRHVYRLDFPYRKEYKEGANIHFFYVREGEAFQQTFTPTYVLPEKKLSLTWKTFRDRLTPGQKEEWVLSVHDKSGKGIAGAEMMATLYDASLEQIAHPMHWNFHTDIWRSVPHRMLRLPNSSHWLSLGVSRPVRFTNSDSRQFTTMTTFFNHRNRWTRMVSRSMGLKGVSVAGPEMTVGYQKAMPLAEEATNDALQGRIAGLNIAETLSEPALLGTKPEVRIRSNFAENAFFYPDLVTGKDGDVNISFTLPESLTEWKFLGYVHTKDMDYGCISAIVVARQEFIVQPNLPRFIREGDNTTISSRIINQSDKDIKGTALLRLLNADNEEVILTQEVPFSVGRDQTESVSFNLSLNSKLSTLICEISAQSDSFSDGERNYIPVLSDRQFITETIPFFLENESSKVIDLHTLYNNGSSTATDKKFSLTFTGNPSSLVFDALKAMQLPEYDNAPCFAASLYANSMLKHLGVDNDSLDILLRQAEERLLGLQNADGSWSWFEGMNGSYYITLSVCENLALLTTTSAEMRIRLNKALDYLDNEELAYFASLQKQKHPSYIPTESTLHYLYLYTLLTDRPMSKEVRKMSDTYLKEFQKMSKNLSIYGKANGSNLLRHNGLTKPAEKFLQSALEYSVYKPGMGRYFDTRKAQYSWRDYKIPTQLAAMRAILQSGNTSFDKLRINSLSTLNSKLSTFIPQMLIWLLRQKQTQTWDNPMNTVDVADFILRLSGGTRPAGTSNESFSLDGKDITANDTIAVEAVSQLTVKATPDTSTSAHISWGAVTASFSELTENIKSNSVEGLNISYEILSSPTGRKASTLKVGDKATIRLTVEADRDMDFVQIDCQHPACFEPTDQHSGYRIIGGQGGYLSRHDSHTEVFFDSFRKGTHVIELEFFVSHEGTYQCGISTARCTYCPDFSAHSSSQTIAITQNRKYSNHH